MLLMFFLASVLAQAVPATESALARAERERSNIVSADVVLSQTLLASGSERLDRPRHVSMHTRVAADQVVGEQLPDPNQPGRTDWLNTYYSPSDGTWDIMTASPLAEHRRDGAPFPLAGDIRALGASSSSGARSIHASLWLLREQAGQDAVYSEAKDGQLIVVTATYKTDTLKWWIDPERQWSIVRCQSWYDDQLMAESKTTLDEMDGYWFPRRIEYFQANYKGGHDPINVIEVQSAKFNRPDHPSAFSPNDIGADVGTLIQEQDARRAPLRLARWDGTKIVSEAEFSRRVQTGELAECEKVRAARTTPEELALLRPDSIVTLQPTTVKPQAPSTSPTSRPATYLDRIIGKWDAYCGQFVTQYGLDDDQRQRVAEIAKECAEAARGYWSAHKEKLQPALDALLAERESHAASRPEHERKLIEMEHDLTAPFAKLFETRLEPRIKTLPNRDQLKRGGKMEPAPDLRP